MRTHFRPLLLIAPILLAGCAEEVEQEEMAPAVDLVSERASVKAVVDRFPEIMEAEDLELLAQTFANDPNLMVFGTDAAERWIGYDALLESIQIQFASYEETDVTVRDQMITVHPSGEVAWFSEVMDWTVIAGGEEVALEGLRFTGVLEKRQGSWMFIQGHASVPVSGQAMQY
jgi:uncharacterized protein (TIGR02246 family)